MGDKEFDDEFDFDEWLTKTSRSFNHLFILDGHTPIPEQDVIKWGKWMQSNSHHVAESFVGNVRVSTVFLGINHRWNNGPPILFETMVFGGELDGEQERYTTWEAAEAGHNEMLQRVVNTVSDWPDDLGEWTVSGNGIKKQ